MTRVSNVDLQKRFPVIQVDSMFQVASVCRSSAQIADLKSLLVDWERVKNVHKNSTLIRGILQSHQKQFILSCDSCTCDVSLCMVS